MQLIGEIFTNRDRRRKQGAAFAGRSGLETVYAKSAFGRKRDHDRGRSGNGALLLRSRHFLLGRGRHRRTARSAVAAAAVATTIGVSAVAAAATVITAMEQAAAPVATIATAAPASAVATM